MDQHPDRDRDQIAHIRPCHQYVEKAWCQGTADGVEELFGLHQQLGMERNQHHVDEAGDQQRRRQHQGIQQHMNQDLAGF